MANLFEDLIPGGGGQQSGNVFADMIPASEPDKPVRFMEEPSALERVIGNVKFPKWLENLRGTAPARVLQGMADPMLGAMQAAANVVLPEAGAKAVNERMADLERDYQAQRRALVEPDPVTGARDPGVDAARIVGNVASPTNAMIALKAPMVATTLPRLAGYGAAVGAGTAAMEPVWDADQGGFAGKKAGQIVGGTLAGAVLTPVLAKAGDAAIRMIGDAAARRQGAVNADQAIAKALDDLGQTIHDVSPQQLAALREQVSTALDSGKQLDAAAALRKADFDALDMPALRGQITRDPMQFAQERDLRGVSGAGEPITAVMQEQGQKLQARIGANADGARDAYNAGNTLADSLKNTDEAMRSHVSGLYGEARASTGKDLDVPLTGLAQDYARVVEDFGDKVPGALRAKFAALGLDPANPSNQKQVFTLERANALLQNINEHVGADRATNIALGRLRDAVKGAVNEADASGGPFAPAVRAASERFKMHDAIPALKAAAEGSVAPDDFVRRFVVGGKTDDVKGLAQVLRQSDPAAYQEARAQLGDELRRGAFGANPAGDSPFSPSRYMETIRRLGVDKLGAFFNAEEVADIMRVGRVGSYMNSVPNASAPNFSNSGKAVVNLLRRVPGVRAIGDVASSAASAIDNGRTARAAVRADVPVENLPLSDRQRNWLRILMLGGAAGTGAATGRQ